MPQVFFLLVLCFKCSIVLLLVFDVGVPIVYIQCTWLMPLFLLINANNTFQKKLGWFQIKPEF